MKKKNTTTKNSTTTKKALPFNADELRDYMRGLAEQQAALFDRRGYGAKPEDADELNNLAAELMNSHYELSVATDALALLDKMIGSVGAQIDAYNAVFGTDTDSFYAPTQSLWPFGTCVDVNEVDDADIPF